MTEKQHRDVSGDEKNELRKCDNVKHVEKLRPAVKFFTEVNDGNDELKEKDDRGLEGGRESERCE